ncbi:ATP-binding protein [Streptomyces sp. TP-A0874]|uniref:ATP-binding protein n=1 Tax=Streptomyces sp. TP-A0874 TaxID=549819 RepID=UPI000D1B9EBA|nr:ATP-binding protein [Streptomyces sp. TP-A0874]
MMPTPVRDDYQDPLGRSVEWSFPGVPDAVRSARAAVRATLQEWQVSAVGDMAVLLVSELVTNSQRYASGPIGLRMERTPGGTLLVEVSDPLPDPPLTRVAAPEDEGGRGLQLVAFASRRWGTRRAAAGKTVWFELALSG